jgi:hypothetical protein
MTRRPFNARALIAGYRAACIAADLDPASGNPRANDNPRWWVQLDLWTEIGDNHSSVEAEALSNIAAEVRRIAGVPWPEAPGVDYAIRPSVRAEIASLAEDGAGRDRQIVMPLREMYAARGEMVDTILGVRMIVPIDVRDLVERAG